MPKYYVSSGNVKKIISISDPKIAAKQLLMEDICNGGYIAQLSKHTAVSETGFALSSSSMLFSTSSLLNELGVL
jgi:hypothetical protein